MLNNNDVALFYNAVSCSTTNYSHHKSLDYLNNLPFSGFSGMP